MELNITAHQDTFTRDHLPPQELWPILEFTLPELQYPARLNAATALIDDAVEAFGADRPALLAPDGTSWSYGELLKHANQVAQVLTEDFGIVPGNRVMLRAPNNAWLVACWLGVIKAGAVVVTTMPALRAAEIDKLAVLTKPSLMLCDHRFLDDARAAAGDTYRVIPVGSEDAGDVVARAASKSGNSTTWTPPLMTLRCWDRPPAPPAPQDHHALPPGHPGQCRYLRPAHPPADAGRCLCRIPPLAFTFGLGGLVVFPLRFGASTLLTERTTPVELATLSHQAGATILFTAPTAYRAILKEGKAELLRTLRLAVSAGEHLPEATWQAVKDATGLELIDGIGSTELLHVFISAAGGDIRPGATGKAVPGFRATILDNDGNELGPDEVGRLAIIGPTGCRYLDDERQLNYVSNGWNVTGDTFVRDAEGYFTYQARSDNMIISSGYNIGGPEVEEAIIQHPDVMETAVVARPDASRGSVVCAFVVLVEESRHRMRRPRNSRTSSRQPSPPTSTRARSVSSTNCPGIPAASCSISNCASR